MKRLEMQGKTQGAEYLALKQQLGATVAEMDKMANTINGLGQETTSLRTKLRSMRDELAPLEDAMQNGTATEAMKKRYMDLSIQAARMQDTMGDVQERIRAMASDTFVFDALAQSVQLAVAGFQAWKGAMSVLGFETQEFEKIIKDLMIAQALSNSLAQISKALQSNSIVMTYLQTKAEQGSTAQKWLAVKAQTALNAAQKAMPFILGATILVGIGKWLFSLTKSTSEAAKMQEDLNKAQSESIKSAGEQAAKIDLLAKTVQKGNLSMQQQEAVVVQLNEALKDSGKEVNNYAEAEQFLTSNSKAYIASLKEKAKQQAILNEYQKAYGELLAAQQEREVKVQKMIEETGMSLDEFSGKLGGLGEEFENKLNAPVEKAQEKLKFLFGEMSTGSALSVEAVKKNTADLIKSIDEAGKTELQKLQEKNVQENKILDIALETRKKQLDTRMKLELFYANLIGMNVAEIRAKYENLTGSDKQIEEINKSKAALEKQYQNQLSSLTKSGEDERTNILYKSQELEIRIMQESFAKTEAELNFQRKKELDAENLSEKDKQNINAHYDNLISKAREENSKKEVEAKKINIENQLSYVEKGSQAELDLKLKALEMQETAELESVMQTGADSEEIVKK
jgi:hypothetical protein